MPMIVNTQWLLDYLEPKVSHEALLDALPRVGLEVEWAVQLSKGLEPVRVGFIREKAAIAGQPGLYVLSVEIERGRRVSIVCGSEHEVQIGWGVPIALAGSKLPTGKSIAAGTVHGQRSEGMVCLDGELGMTARDSGMFHTTDESALGRSLPQITSVPEYLVEVNVLPNRPDCLGIIGIAREVAALLNLKLKYPQARSLTAQPAGPGDRVSVEIKDPQLAPRYMCRLLKGVKVGPSPAWLKAILLATGSRPINNIVDITNFVLYEWGQPLHAFDYSKVEGGQIIVRRMNKGETLELLTGKVIEGEASGLPLVIADRNKPIALAGVMGGRATQTTEQTQDVLLEAAHFEPVNIRRTARRVDLGIESRGTASSYRFERGTDPNRMLDGALERATSLIAELAGGKPAGPIHEQHPLRREPRTFSLDPKRVGGYLGMPVDAATIRQSLVRLEMNVDESLKVSVPTWRVDVNDPVVLIEDVARQVGYDKIPVAPTPSAPTRGQRSSTERVREAVAVHLAEAGYLECRNPPLESPKDSAYLDAISPPVSIRNPATQDMSVLRRSLITGLLRVAERNIRRGAESIRVYETDRAFIPDGGQAPERWRVAGLAGGVLRRSDWRGGGNSYDFYHAKGAVQDLLESLRVKECSFTAANHPAFIAGTAAQVHVAGQVIGALGEITPGLLDVAKLPFRLYAFELDLAPLEEPFGALPGHRGLARTPAVTRDLAIVVKATEVYAGIEETIRRSAGSALESLRLVDQYTGQQVPQGHKSLAFRLVFRDPARTLTAEEVQASVDQVVKSLKETFGAELRT